MQRVEWRPSLKYRIMKDDKFCGDTQFFSEAWSQVESMKRNGENGYATEIRLENKDSKDYSNTGVRIKV